MFFALHNETKWLQNMNLFFDVTMEESCFDIKVVNRIRAYSDKSC